MKEQALKERILFVDDDPNILEAYQRKLQQVLYVHTAQGPHVGLRDLQQRGPFAVVVADMNMPLMNGVEFLKKVRELAPDTVRMMLTGNMDIKVAMEAVNDGNVFRFLTKPCPSKLMGEALLAGIKQYRMITAEREVLEGTLKGTAELLTEVLSWTSPEAFGKALQLRNTARIIVSKLNIENSWEVELAATLCQIGILAIPTEIPAKLMDGEELADEEIKALESVPAIGHELLARIPRIEKVAEIILYQDKHFDGTGYPETQGQNGDIPIGSNILKAAKDFHELRAEGYSRNDCLREMRARDGWYNPAVLDAFGLELPAAAAASASPAQIVQMPLRDLKAGLTLAEPILTRQGRKLVSTGTTISVPLLIRLRKYSEANNIQEPIGVRVPR